MSKNVAKNTVQEGQQEGPTLPHGFKVALWVLREFGKLQWLKDIKNFVLELVVQLSEILVIVALVLSMVNFLTGGTVMHQWPWLNDAWAWLQAVAIDAGLGVVLINFLDNFKKDTAVQCVIYGILTALLAFNAGVVTYIDSLATAAHLPMSDPGVNQIPLWILSLTRAIAVVGFLGVSRIHSYDFTKIVIPDFLHLVKEESKIVALPDANVQEIGTEESIVKALPEPEGQGEIQARNEQEQRDDTNVTNIDVPFARPKKKDVVRKIFEVKPGKSNKTDEAIKAAIKELNAEGTKITDGNVAQKAGVSRATVMRWREKQTGVKNDEAAG